MSDMVKTRVSIGLPVYNGEAYLGDALDSILGQTFEDFELIISDNASTDRTEEICRAYAGRDKRIRYSRNATNVGASKNFNRVLELADGEYFRWAAHDDMLAPDFLRRCLEVLERDPSVVLCFSHITIVDPAGNVRNRNYTNRLKVDSPKPHVRFGELAIKAHGCFHVWGLMRTEVVKKTAGLASYIGSDRPLLAELGLAGRFFEIPEDLFILRNHSQRSVKAQPFYLRATWFDPDNKGKMLFPHWRCVQEYAKAVRRASLRKVERLLCYLQLARWLATPRNCGKLALDLFVVAAPVGWKLHLAIKRWYDQTKRKWTSSKPKPVLSERDLS